jgi:hypothetical protein
LSEDIAKSMKDPMNELERAYAAALRGPEGRPEFFRQLRESTLAFLMPYQPEMESMVGFQNGDTMTVSVWENPQGSFIPTFTSMERAEQALETIGAPDNAFSLAEMKGKSLWQALVSHKHWVVINPACGLGEMRLGLNAVKLLADGSSLKPIPPGPTEHGQATIVEPADSPTDFI